MTTLTVELTTFRPHAAVKMHAWDPAGDKRDADGVSIGDRRYRFTLDMDATDLTRVSFKFWYPGEAPEWEADEFVRQVPFRGPGTAWAAEFSSRCLDTDPGAVAPFAPGSMVTFGAVTARRFAGGMLYAWDPASGLNARFPETGRDPARNLSFFGVALADWMASGFHFKLVAPGGAFEPDASNRFWRPVDGAAVYLKSGQVEVRREVPVAVDVPISVIAPAALAATTALHVRDAVDDFAADAARAGMTAIDGDFVAVDFTVSIYPAAQYFATARADAGAESQAYAPMWSLPLRIASGAPPVQMHTLLGVSEWYAARPARDARVELRIHRNPATTFGPAITVPWHLGFPRRTRDETTTPVAGTATAHRGADGTWTAQLSLFRGVPHWLDALRSGDAVEARADGPTLSQRELRPTASATVVHTIDGQTGLSPTAPRADLFAEAMAPTSRQALMRAAFGAPIVDAGVFGAHELPHGATWIDGTLLFVLPAPHAVVARVLLLDRRASTAGKREVSALPMQLTKDLRYWWCVVRRDALPDPARVEYRFQMGEALETLDPASRDASLAEYVWADPGQGVEGAWSIAVDRGALVTAATSPGWQTPFWNEFIIYELHARRFTERNLASPAGPPAVALAQLRQELARYLGALPVTALELLPVNEFPKYVSWGYDSSLYFAVESSYGGSSGFAAFVGAAHRAGKALVLDVVFNHLTDTPMQALARDVFADGQTQWGDMVNYDHPACLEFFRQALVHLYDTYQLDGFRFDATEAIVNGHVQNPYIIRDGRVGSGGGWEFLRALHAAIEAAAGACGRRWPFSVAENRPENWPMDGQVVDGQWDFAFQGKVGWAAACDGDAAPELADVLRTAHHVQEMVNFPESHDSCSAQGNGETRLAARGPFGTGMRMAKACGAVAILAKGVPMFFMGAEAGEVQPFAFGGPMVGTLPLDRYEDPGTENNHVLVWYRDLLGLRKDWGKGLAGDDVPFVGRGNRTIAFSRDGGRIFVVATFGTPDRRQNLGWLGLPQGCVYKEVFNSTWPVYGVAWDGWSDNGGHGATLTSDAVASLPEIGAVVLERIRG